MNRQETKGQVKKLEGKAKEVVGIVTGDKKLQRKGARLRAEGAIQQAAGKAARKVGEGLAEVADAIKK